MLGISTISIRNPLSFDYRKNVKLRLLLLLLWFSAREEILRRLV